MEQVENGRDSRNQNFDQGYEQAELPRQINQGEISHASVMEEHIEYQPNKRVKIA